MTFIAENATTIDEKLSQRFIELDPEGYFIIYLDRDKGLICAEHFTNNINDQGLAVDPETGEPFACDKPLKRKPTATFTGRTAKEIGVQITELTKPSPVSRLDHALYLGRELVRAEMALLQGSEYVQD